MKIIGTRPTVEAIPRAPKRFDTPNDFGERYPFELYDDEFGKQVVAIYQRKNDKGTRPPVFIDYITKKPSGRVVIELGWGTGGVTKHARSSDYYATVDDAIADYEREYPDAKYLGDDYEKVFGADTF